MHAISLLGRNWPELGPLALLELDDGGALALSRGAKPKSYTHEDPNEDAALLVRLPTGVLLAVADGHNGLEAAERVIERTQAGAEFLLLASGADFRARVCELLDDVRGRLARGSKSRASFVVAALGRERVELASFGDAYAFRSGWHSPLMPQNSILVGSARGPRQIDASRWYRSFARTPGERVALVSDGVINFMPDPSEIPGLLQTAESDLACAETLARAAMQGGAGDNVAVAVFAGAIGL